MTDLSICIPYYITTTTCSTTLFYPLMIAFATYEEDPQLGISRSALHSVSYYWLRK